MASDVQPGVSNQWNWVPISMLHRAKLKKLHKYCQRKSKKIKKINGVRVCFDSDFMIGKGRNDTRVYIGLSEDGHERAVKRLVKDTCGNLSLLKDTCESLHENIVLNTSNAMNSKRIARCWFYDDESDNEYVYLIFDLCEETLKEYIKKQSLENLTKEAPGIIRQMLEGLNELHCGPKPILHRDLKPSNIMRNVKGNWLLVDFGISQQLPHEKQERGTQVWRAVESYPPENTTDIAYYKKQSDIQALAMVCFYLLTKGNHPFGTERDRIQNLLNGNPVGLVNLTDPVIKDLISWMLQHNPNDRPYTHEALKHPYLQPADQQFELLDRVGNQEEIEKRDSSCDVVKEINTNPLLFNITWKSQIPLPVLKYLCSYGKNPLAYGDEWSECLRLIRKTSQHWNDIPHPKVHCEIFEPQDYFLKVFPTLPDVVYRVIKRHSDWTSRKSLAKFFDGALKHSYPQRPDQQFRLLTRVGKQEEIMKRNYSCDVVKEINTDPSLSNVTWKSQIPAPVLAYLRSYGKRPLAYGDEWSECLRLIRNTSQHWTDIPHPEVNYEIDKPQDYFLKVFPTLPVVVYRVIRSHSNWTSRESLAKFFDDEAKLEDDNKAAVAETLQHGGKKNNRISLLFIGQDGVGKTSLKKSILGEKAEQDQASTIGIEYEVVEVKESNKSNPWKRAADSQFIASKQYTDNIIAKETAKRKYESQNNLVEEDKDESRRHDEDGQESDKFGGGEIESDVDECEGERRYEAGGGEVEGNKFATAGGSHQDEGEKNVEEERKTQESRKLQMEYQVSDKQIEEAMKNVDNFHDDTMDTIRFLVGDVGGQSVFYDVHSTMLRLTTLFTLVVDLTKSPNDVAQPKFVEEETKKVEDLGNAMQETNLDYLTRWAAALRNLNPCDNDAETENAVESLEQPKTIIVYTKSDKLSDEEVETKKEEVRRAVDEQLRRVGCNSLIVREFVIKNMEPRSPEESKDLEDLRATIFETAQDILKKQEKTPVNWLVLERLLDEKKREATMRDRPYIEFDEAKQLGKQCKVVDKTFNDAMKFFHEENIVVHFQGNPPISDLVVLDPAWLVKLFTEVITVSKNRSLPPAQSSAWNDLREKGKLNFDKLPTKLDNHRGIEDSLKEMMVRAGLICFWRENIYLVPSMVKEKMEKKDILKLLSDPKCLKPSLFLDFKDKSIPLGFYTRFQVELWKWDDSSRESEQWQFWCNFMRLVKTLNGSTYSVILVRHLSRIEFAILVHGGNSAKTTEWTDIAKMVLLDLDEMIKRIQSTHPSFKGMRYKFGLKCDLCIKKTDRPCERHSKKACSDDDCVHIWSLDELKEPLISCPRNDSGADDSELHQTPWVKATAESCGDTDNADIEAPEQEEPTSVPQVGQQSVNDLNSLVRNEICKKLDLQNLLGTDYRGLAARFDMLSEDIRTISQSLNPTDNVLKWVGYNPKNTIAKLLEVLKAMGRDDCVDIIDSKNSCS